MDIHNEYLPFKSKELFFYRGKPVLNKRHSFEDVDGNPWDFSLATGYTFNIWEEREGGALMIAWTSPTNLTLSGSDPNEIILNAPASDTDIERGKYYYEIEYTVAGGYPVLIAYGKAQFI